MYGIAGWIDEVSEPEEMSQRMAQRLRHRGPDGQGIYPSLYDEFDEFKRFELTGRR